MNILNIYTYTLYQDIKNQHPSTMSKTDETSFTTCIQKKDETEEQDDNERYFRQKYRDELQKIKETKNPIESGKLFGEVERIYGHKIREYNDICTIKKCNVAFERAKELWKGICERKINSESIEDVNDLLVHVLQLCRNISFGRNDLDIIRMESLKMMPHVLFMMGKYLEALDAAMEILNVEYNKNISSDEYYQLEKNIKLFIKKIRITGDFENEYNRCMENAYDIIRKMENSQKPNKEIGIELNCKLIDALNNLHAAFLYEDGERWNIMEIQAKRIMPKAFVITGMYDDAFCEATNVLEFGIKVLTKDEYSKLKNEMEEIIKICKDEHKKKYDMYSKSKDKSLIMIYKDHIEVAELGLCRICAW